MTRNHTNLARRCARAGLPEENFGLTQKTQKTQNLVARSNGLEFTEIANCCALAGLPDGTLHTTP